ncbi:hypothetical protein PSPO01_03152 [Paraphaeosphaeria sporulosa]
MLSYQNGATCLSQHSAIASTDDARKRNWRRAGNTSPLKRKKPS